MQIWIFTLVFLWNYEVDFLHHGFNRQLFKRGALFDRQRLVLVPSVGILIVQKLKNELVILTYLDIQNHISSSTLPASLLQQKSWSTVLIGKWPVKKPSIYLCTWILTVRKHKNVNNYYRSRFSNTKFSKTTSFSFSINGWIKHSQVEVEYTIGKRGSWSMPWIPDSSKTSKKKT